MRRAPEASLSWSLPLRSQHSGSRKRRLRNGSTSHPAADGGRGQRIRRPAAAQSVIGDARIVSLGEATHGSREFFQLKHRMLEFLATEMGFTIFSIEANMPEAYRLNDYVLNGHGRSGGAPARDVLLDVGHRRSARHDPVDARIQRIGQGQRAVHRLRHADADRRGRRSSAISSARAMPASCDVGSTRPSSRGRAARAAAGPAFGVATGTFPVTPRPGSAFDSAATSRPTAITRGYAGLWWRVDGKTAVLAFDNMQNRGGRGTTDWKPIRDRAAGRRRRAEHQLRRADAGRWHGVVRRPDGRARRRAVSPTRDPFDLELRVGVAASASPRAARVTASASIGRRRSGKQSLRMQACGRVSATPPAANDHQRGRAPWRAVVSHLEASRATYRSARRDRPRDRLGDPERDASSCRECRCAPEQVSRDRSMAENVKWILDQNPERENRALGAQRSRRHGRIRYETMGETLQEDVRPRDGRVRLCVQSRIVPGDGAAKGLDDVHGGPGAGGQSRRHARGGAHSVVRGGLAQLYRWPGAGAGVGPWINQQQKTRWVGSTYFEKCPLRPSGSTCASREAFDVTLFIDLTTAARANPR